MKNIIVLLALVFALGSCKKTVDELPAETQTGANTFGAKINGENWGPLGGSFLTSPTLEAHVSADSSIVINARNFSRTPTETEMEIYLRHVAEPATYSLNQATEVYPSQSASYAYYVKREVTVQDEWITGPSATGSVTVSKIDWPARIISGTFSFTAAARYGSAPLTVSEGRFDVKFQ